MAKNTSPTKKSKSNKIKPQLKPVARPATQSPRRLKQPQYKAWRLTKRIKHPVKLPSSWWLTKQTARTLWTHKRLFGGITVIYGLLNLVLVKGLSIGPNITALKSSLQAAFGGNSFDTGLTVFGYLVSNSGSNSNATGAGYQLFLLLIVSLAVIWALREVMAGSRLRIRDAYYRGMYPLVPFVLVLAVICLQLIPLAVGASIYNIVISNGIAVYLVEKILWALLFGILTLLSLYMISSSVFALYIVTLPDMTPLKALRSARQLVRNRRWTVLRKVIILPLILLIVAIVIMLPIIMLLTPLSQAVFYLLTMLAVVVVHSYLYSLYRELLHE